MYVQTEYYYLLNKNLDASYTGIYILNLVGIKFNQSKCTDTHTDKQTDKNRGIKLRLKPSDKFHFDL